MKNYISVKAEYGSRSSTTEINKVAKDGYEFVAFHKVDGVSYALMVKEVEEEVKKEVEVQKEEVKKPKPFCNQCKFYSPGSYIGIFGTEEDNKGLCSLKKMYTDALYECWCFKDLLEELERSGEEE